MPSDEFIPEEWEERDGPAAEDHEDDIDGHMLLSIWMRVAQVNLSPEGEQPIEFAFDAIDQNLEALENFVKECRAKLKRGDLHLLGDDGYVRECARPVTKELVYALADIISSQLRNIAYALPVLPRTLDERLGPQ